MLNIKQLVIGLIYLITITSILFGYVSGFHIFFVIPAVVCFPLWFNRYVHSFDSDKEQIKIFTTWLGAATLIIVEYWMIVLFFEQLFKTIMDQNSYADTGIIILFILIIAELTVLTGKTSQKIIRLFTYYDHYRLGGIRDLLSKELLVHGAFCIYSIPIILSAGIAGLINNPSNANSKTGFLLVFAIVYLIGQLFDKFVCKHVFKIDFD
ncbi:hypothetical protein [Methanocella arvoryzae]|nr:hypothetical protein [Methanocella arvoryzae]